MSRALMKLAFFMFVLLLLVLMHGSAAALFAAEELECEDGRKPVGNLGITDMSMKGSLGIGIYEEDEPFWWHFQAEPKIEGVDPDGPSAGKLKKGDVIVAIDGMLITTRKAGIRFANLVPGEAVELTVRRRWRTIKTEITPTAVCIEDHPLYPGPNVYVMDAKLEKLSRQLEALSELHIQIPELPELPELPGLPELPDFSPYSFLPRAWFGMGISCDGCTIKRSKDDEPAQWSFDKPPSVQSVDPGGPADEAGLREGDVLTHIDGIELDSRRGGKRFSSLEPGEKVTWTIRRDGEKHTIEMVATEHPEPRPTVGPRARIEYHGDRFPLRFSGVLGGTDVEVRGKSSVHVAKDDSLGEIVITTRDATIRIRLSDEKD